MDGQQLYELLLEKYHLQMEMASGHYATALTSIMDTDEGFARLSRALAELDREEAERRKRLQQEKADLTGQEEQNGFREDCSPPVPVELYQPRKKEMELSDAVDAETSEILLEQAAGHVSAEFIYLYPPGIPIIAPGELLTEQVISQIQDCQRRGLQVQGMRDQEGRMVQVADDLHALQICGKSLY